jgi:hypothetical protein
LFIKQLFDKNEKDWNNNMMDIYCID